MPPPFVPKVTPAQANAIITAPGSPFETELLKVPYRGDKCPPLKVYKNLPPTIGSVFFSAVNQFADREYLKLYSGNPKAFDEEFKRGSLVTLTYGQAKDQVIKLMWILKEKYGIKKGDKVGIAAKNSPAWALVFWAAVSLGAVLVGANAWLLGGELEYCLDLADVKVLLVDSERMERLLGKKESGGSFLDALFGKGKLEAVVVEGAIPRHEFGSKVAGFEQLLVGPSRAEPAITDVRPDDDAIILFSGCPERAWIA